MAAALLTHAECEKILATQPVSGLKLKHYDIVKALEAHGFLGEYYRLFLYCEKADNFFPPSLKSNEASIPKEIILKFFIKSLPQASADTEKYNVYRKETQLYASLLQQLQKYSTTVWSAKAYYTHTELFVMEDLCEMGYESCRHNEANLTDCELKAILSALAALHAASLCYELHEGHSISAYYPAEMLQEVTVAPHVVWYTTGLKAILTLAKQHPKYQYMKLQNFIQNQLEHQLGSVYEMQHPSTKYRNVLCHRDPWRGNVLFDYVKMRAVLVDFQTCRYCPPCIDVIYAIFMNLDSNMRKSSESAYLTWYHEQLSLQLARQHIDVEAFFPKQQLLASYEDFKLFGYLYRAIAITIINVPASMITNDYKFGKRGEILLNYMKENTNFRELIESSIAELVDFVLNNNLMMK